MRGRPVPGTLRDVADSKPLRVWLELSLGDQISGRLVDEGGGDHVFCGWLGFFSLIDRLDAKDDEPSQARRRRPLLRDPPAA